MSRITGRDTAPERALRSALHRAGLRFRLHRRDLPGRPDIVLPSRRLAIFVHGCFWHRHEGCRFTTTPTTNAEFWQRKFASNTTRDAANVAALEALGWRVIVAWECEVKTSLDDLVIRVLGTVKSH
jgi:DNA mismatch endonuclease (patch repair protein)